jgi:hypothetical protein
MAVVEQRQLPVLDVVVPNLQAATDDWSNSSSLFASMNSTLDGLRVLIAQLPATECADAATANKPLHGCSCSYAASTWIVLVPFT